MWYVSGIAEAGLRNREAGLRCQDAICYEESSGVKAIALSDGTGDTDYAGIGAYHAAHVVAKLISSNFAELWNMEDKDVQFNIITNVRSELFKRCDEYGVKIEQLQSTLVGLAIDDKNGRFIAVHLGDGYIRANRMMEDSDEGETVVISGPENGYTSQQTYLTSMVGAGKHVRIIKSRIDKISGFILESDGWKESRIDDRSFIALKMD